nr:hypothetical protein [Tanacetum cinerariifolium]
MPHLAVVKRRSKRPCWAVKCKNKHPFGVAIYAETNTLMGYYAAVMPRLLVDRRDGDGSEAGGVKRLWRQQVVSEAGGVVLVGGVVVPAAMVAVHGDGGWWIL